MGLQHLPGEISDEESKFLDCHYCRCCYKFFNPITDFAFGKEGALMDIQFCIDTLRNCAECAEEKTCIYNKKALEKYHKPFGMLCEDRKRIIKVYLVQYDKLKI
jgi:hypothetical protein